MITFLCVERRPKKSLASRSGCKSAGRLEWAGDEDDGYLGRGLVEGKYPIAYTVMPVVFRGCEHFEAKIITDPNADFALSVKKLADRYGAALTRDQKGQRRTIAPVPTADEAKELCEIAYGNRGGAGDVDC